MRIKVAMMITMAVVLVGLVGSGPALAQVIGGVIQCQTVPCVATGDARSYTNDRDVTKGSGGHDLLRVNDGDTMDGAIGGPGWDTCVVDASIEAADTCETVIFR
ncbi:MAG: hypothetical protein K0Q96_718 [Rubrobacteraceae bacterium]|nr:hypothetical protein [Rubrobacteraceae bacterium]